MPSQSNSARGRARTRAGGEDVATLAAQARREARAPQPLPDHSFRQILQIAHRAVISLDEDYRITFFNEGAERIFGYRTEEVLG